MHIEPGIVEGAKVVLGYATATGAALYAVKATVHELRRGGVASWAVRTTITALAAFSFFQILPHYPVGVSEVHFILGSTLFLLFGMAPAAAGLALGLLIQGLLFAPHDLPQFGMNVTTLLVPLVALGFVARRVIGRDTAYVDLQFRQVFALSAAYQAGVVAWVGFWAFYGQGFGAANLLAVGSFGAAYMLVILVEPLVDMGVLALAKATRGGSESGVFEPRLLRIG